ncbi:MAG TPA: rod shape-determining protein MreD [Allosphingosinicella sp.]|jgi:rod shape-determining protein MreD
MSRIALTQSDVRMKDFRRSYVPILSTVAACLLALLPVIVSSPVIPDFAFLVLISWRLLRPELWTATTALPLGLFNDLVAGHPLGQSMALWTIAFLVFDLIEARIVYKDYWMDWAFAALMIVGYTFGDWYVGRLMGSQMAFSILLPQLLAGILVYPVVARFILALDRWRLSR